MNSQETLHSLATLNNIADNLMKETARKTYLLNKSDKYSNLLKK